MLVQVVELLENDRGTEATQQQRQPAEIFDSPGVGNQPHLFGFLSKTLMQLLVLIVLHDDLVK